MRLKFSDYKGPTGLYIATGDEILPLDGPAGALAFVGAGLQAGTIDPDQSERIQARIDKGMQAARPDRKKRVPKYVPDSAIPY
jgi:hypothetical protein